MVSLANLHMRPEVLARYYVRSHWHTGCVKKLSWKTIESSVSPATAKYDSDYVESKTCSFGLDKCMIPDMKYRNFRQKRLKSPILCVYLNRCFWVDPYTPP